MKILFLIILAIFMLHEMDAIRTKEWRIFVFLKDLKEETAYIIFSIVHLPLYFIFFLLLTNWDIDIKNLFTLIINMLLILHAIVHYSFKNHRITSYNVCYTKLLRNGNPLIQNKVGFDVV